MVPSSSLAGDSPVPFRRGTVLQKLLLAAPAALAVANCLKVTSHWGVGVTTDSVRYIAAARHLASGAGLLTHEGGLLVRHPPLYPAVLAALDRALSVDPLTSARLVGALLMGAVVYLAGLLMLGHLRRSPWLVFLSVALLAIAGPLFQVSTMAWSEPLFLTCALLCLLGIESYVRRGDARTLVFTAVAAALACLTRYVGGTLILTGAVCILVLGRRSPTTRWKHTSVVLLIALVPVGLWLLRNALLTGTLVGARSESPLTLWGNVERTFAVTLGWFAYGGAIGRRVVAALLVGALAAMAALGARGRWVRVRERLLDLAPVLLFTVVYAVVVVAGAATVRSDVVSTRLLSPIFVPLVLFLTALVQGAVAPGPPRWIRKLTSVVATTLLVVLMLAPVGLTALLVGRYAEEEGAGLNSSEWRGSETAGRLVQLQRAAPAPAIYSNEPAALYFLSGSISKRVPVKWEHQAEDGTLDLSGLVGAWPPEGDALLVWFHHGRHRPRWLEVHELMTIADVDVVERLGDGMICRVRRREASSDSLSSSSHRP